ncbi:MAG: hypothetical protein QNL90_21850 [Gammaproteobacteria bacterium]|nr:hypothetical protein [Gammaproteobacteria bacterium]MDX2462802.1 hypothetical protein [Gammaproteobacteria bacterium]
MDTDDLINDVISTYTLGELIAFYRPDSEPTRKWFGDVYENAGNLVMQHMESIKDKIDATEK